MFRSCLLLISMLVFGLIAQSCRKSEDRLGRVNVNTTIEISGASPSIASVRAGVVKKEGVGQVIGGGAYLHGERITIQANVFPDSDYKLISLYEKSSKGGYTKERGLVNETSLSDGYKKVKDTLCAITLNVKEDMTFIAAFVSSNGDIDIEDVNIEIGGVQVQDIVNATDTISFGTIESNDV